jgi:hypothetical protein
MTERRYQRAPSIRISNSGQSFAFSRHVLPELCSALHPLKKEGAGKAGRRLAPAVRGKEMPFPAQWFTTYFVLSSGRRAQLPPSPCGCFVASRTGWCEPPPQGLTPASGARTTRLRRPRTPSLGSRRLACAHRRGHAKTLSAPCRRTKALAHGAPERDSRPANASIAPDAVASIAPQPAVRDDRDPPLFVGPGCFACTTNPNFGKVEYFCGEGLTSGGEVFCAQVFCPTGTGQERSPGAWIEPTGRREAPPDDRLRAIRDNRIGSRRAPRISLRSIRATSQELLLRRQADHLAAAVHFLEAADEVFRTLPARRDFQSHEIGDTADEARAVGCFGVPDR